MPTRHDNLNVSSNPAIQRHFLNCWESDEFPLILEGVQNFVPTATRIDIIAIKIWAIGGPNTRNTEYEIGPFTELRQKFPPQYKNEVSYSTHDMRKYVYPMEGGELFMFAKGNKNNSWTYIFKVL